MNIKNKFLHLRNSSYLSNQTGVSRHTDKCAKISVVVNKFLYPAKEPGFWTPDPDVLL